MPDRGNPVCGFILAARHRTGRRTRTGFFALFLRFTCTAKQMNVNRPIPPKEVLYIRVKQKTQSD